ncbi:MAG: hypothetical protein AAF721_01115 [Myxococcota bacterium]
MHASDSGYALVEQGLRRRRFIGRALTVAVVGTAAWLAWTRLLARPGPESICAAVDDLARKPDARNSRAAARLVSRVAPGASAANNPQAEFNAMCGVFFSALRDAEDFDHGSLGRCLVNASDAREGLGCFGRVYPDPGDAAIRSYLESLPPEFPNEPPELPPKVAASYDDLVAISERALAMCDEIWDPTDGCYGYTSFGDARRELAVQIPGAALDATEGLLLLEATCRYDVARLIERYPAVRERVANAPIPAEHIVCSYLPLGDPREAAACRSTWKPRPGKSSAGRRGAVSVSIPYYDECAGRMVQLTIVQENEQGVGLELEAIFAGPDYTPLPPESSATESDSASDGDG